MVTIYFAATFCASVINVILLLRAHQAPARAHFRMRARIAEGMIAGIVIIWSFWAFVSALTSAGIASEGLPLMWITYTIANFINLACIALSALAFARKLYDVIQNGKMPHMLGRIEELTSGFRLGAGLCSIISGIWTVAYAVLYFTGKIIL
jgi:hypothetical protein